MPDMICHYMADHKWLPPQDFIDDVLTSKLCIKHQGSSGYQTVAQSIRRVTTIMTGTKIGYLTGDFTTGTVPPGFLARLKILMDLATTNLMRVQTKGLPPAYIKSAAIKDQNGVVYVGHRHHKIFPLMPEELIRDSVQGFVTNADRFVTREEGAAIAYTAGQIPEPKKTLFSEDLY